MDGHSHALLVASFWSQASTIPLLSLLKVHSSPNKGKFHDDDDDDDDDDYDDDDSQWVPLPVGMHSV